MTGPLLHPTLRPLGAAERLMYHYSAAHPRHFCVVAQIKADRSVEEYRRAVRAVQLRHPILRAGIARDPSSGPFFFGGSLVEPVLLPRTAHKHWTEVVKTELESKFDEAAPLFRATIQVDALRADVILTFHHAIADGKAGIVIIEDLMRSLAGEDLEPLGFPNPLESYLGGFPQEGVGGFSYSKDMTSTQTLLDVAEQSLWRSFEGDTLSVTAAKLDSEITQNLQTLCRRMDTTVNSAICTALAIVAGEREERDEYRILSAIDPRTILGIGSATCGLRAIAATHSLSSQQVEDFWGLARKHRRAVAKSCESETIQQTVRAIEALIHPTCEPPLASGLLGSMKYDAVVSNLGKLGTPMSINDIELEAIWGPVGQARLKDERFLGVATSGGVLRFLEAVPAHQQSILIALRDYLARISQYFHGGERAGA